jgi:hypothetical protein
MKQPNIMVYHTNIVLLLLYTLLFQVIILHIITLFYYLFPYISKS